MMKSLSMSPATFGLILSAFGVGHLVMQLPGGYIADRWGAKPMLVAGPLLWALFTGSTALTVTVVGLWAVRAALGASEGLFATSTSKVLGESFPSKERARALAISNTAVPLAPALAGPLVGVLVAGYGWQAMFGAIAIPSVLAAIACYVLVPSGRPTLRATPSGSDPHASFASVLKQPGLWLASLGGFGFIVANWGFTGWMPSYLALQRHVRLQSLGAVSSIPYIFGFFGILVGGTLGSGWLYHRRLLLISGACLGAGLSLLVAYRADGVPYSLAGLSGAAFFLFCTQPPLSSIVLDLAPERYRASYQGVYNTIIQSGGIVAPALIGWLISRTGSFAAGFGVMILSLCLAAVCMFCLTPFITPRVRALEPPVMDEGI